MFTCGVSPCRIGFCIYITKIQNKKTKPYKMFLKCSEVGRKASSVKVFWYGIKIMSNERCTVWFYFNEVLLQDQEVEAKASFPCPPAQPSTPSAPAGLLATPGQRLVVVAQVCLWSWWILKHHGVTVSLPSSLVVTECFWKDILGHRSYSHQRLQDCGYLQVPA